MVRQTKLSDLENRRLRQEKELADLEQKQKDLEDKIARKKEELEATNSNVIAEILVSHQLPMSEFLKQMPQMVEQAKNPSKQEKPSPVAHLEEESHESL
ncbi:hypothetical protein GRR92_11820 [Lactococcus lactis subsp. lactis]|uniref:hypothetical protein n=1 Tax=Lactococcus lactis TaxID=1358 RepID=UPI001BA944F7|nr:hypothetical protein [Lactococcus lactis]MBR8675026.1 hypothetical protein [Lactococcus lactis subsp. lactis]MBR8677810.1 hypothetical protein [Lactococcus lactis subsp. lactis]MBR8685297.1 hypothetical protein [Lactococcus lactis subsp. lactis]